MEFDAAGDSCYVGYEDFGNLIVELYSGTCITPKITAKWSAATYPTGLYRDTNTITRGTNSSLKTYQQITATSCNSPATTT